MRTLPHTLKNTKAFTCLKFALSTKNRVINENAVL